MNWRHYLLLALFGLIVSGSIAAFQSVPGYMDADYYYAGGLQLAAGRGFTEPYLWNYLGDPAGLPHPSHAYWMPLASILAALVPALSGHLTWFAARLPFILAAVLIPPLTSALAFSITSRRDLAIISGLLAVFSGYYAPFLPLADTFSLCMLFGALFFLIVNRKSSIANSLLLGLLAGLMHLSRADGVLWLLLALLVVVLQKPFHHSSSISLPYTFDKRENFNANDANERISRMFFELYSRYLPIRGIRVKKCTAEKSSITFYVLRITSCISGYLLIMSPWLVRNLAVFGTPLAPGGSRALWLTGYNQLFAYPASQLTFAAWWQSGLAEILKARLWALGLNLESAFAVQGNIFLLPFILIGLWQIRRDGRLRLAVLAWGLTLAVMTLVFPFAGARGGFFHSGAALQPFWWAVAPLGLERLVAWGARRRGWPEIQAFTVFSAGLVGIAALLTALIVQGRVIGQFNGDPVWGREASAYSQIEEFLRSTYSVEKQGALDEEVVIVANPPGYYLASDRSAVAIPDGDEQTVLQVAGRYGGQYLILEKDSLPHALEALYARPDRHPNFRYLGEVEEARIYAIQP
ncbi:MAG: hypothetical protein QMD04_09195 [Anaerolineales bacterium]|nr:hypothetical protein [Anaerolineales bacterium]